MFIRHHTEDHRVLFINLIFQNCDLDESSEVQFRMPFRDSLAQESSSATDSNRISDISTNNELVFSLTTIISTTTLPVPQLSKFGYNTEYA